MPQVFHQPACTKGQVRKSRAADNRSKKESRLAREAQEEAQLRQKYRVTDGQYEVLGSLGQRLARLGIV